MAEGLDPWRAGQPDGGMGVLVGDAAWNVLADLCDEHVNNDLASWQLEDAISVMSWQALERQLRELPLPNELDLYRQRLPFHRLVDQFHSALPYSEAERHWLVDTEPAPLPPTSPDVDQEAVLEMQRRYHERYFDLEVRTVSAGLIRVVSGRDLMRRWMSWRSEADEYTGQGSLNPARDALAGLIKLVAPDETMPTSQA
jgi:hypothetical protein